MIATEPADDPGQGVGGQGGEAGDGQAARLQPGDCGYRRPARLHVPECLTGGSDQRRPGRSHDHPPAQTVEEGSAQFGFQLLDRQ